MKFIFALLLLVCVSAGAATFTVVTDTNGVLLAVINGRNTNFFNTNMSRIMAAITNDAPASSWFINASTNAQRLRNKTLADGAISNVVAQSLQSSNLVNWGDLFIGDPTSGNYSAWAVQTGTNTLGKAQFRVYNDDLLGSVLSITEDSGVTTTLIGNSPSSDVTTNNGTFYATRIITPSLVMVGSNRFDGSVYYTVTNATGMANGDVLLDLGRARKTHTISGNTAAINICGIKYGIDGREMRIVKTNAYNVVIRNASGAAGTASNERIFTGTGADVTRTNTPDVMDFVWDPSLAAWIYLNQ